MGSWDRRLPESISLQSLFQASLSYTTWLLPFRVPSTSGNLHAPIPHVIKCRWQWPVFMIWRVMHLPYRAAIGVVGIPYFPLVRRPFWLSYALWGLLSALQIRINKTMTLALGPEHSGSRSWTMRQTGVSWGPCPSVFTENTHSWTHNSESCSYYSETYFLFKGYTCQV